MDSIGYHDYYEKPKTTRKTIKAKCAGCGKRKTIDVCFKTYRGQHWTDDSVKCWIECSDCGTKSWSYKDSWNCVSEAIDAWNKGGVSVPESIAKREKVIRKLKAENKRLKKGGHSK